LQAPHCSKRVRGLETQINDSCTNPELPGKRPDELGANAAKELIENLEHGGTLDEYATDQVIIFMALAKGKSTVVVGPLSLHTQTSIHFSQLMTGVRPILSIS